ncbi:MAG: hypothetical protein ACRENF_06545, partial [Thermodesulfobacteriota bacterium]
MKKTWLIVALMAWNLYMPPPLSLSEEKDTIYQTSTINALFKGVYDGRAVAQILLQTDIRSDKMGKTLRRTKTTSHDESSRPTPEKIVL